MNTEDQPSPELQLFRDRKFGELFDVLVDRSKPLERQPVKLPVFPSRPAGILLPKRPRSMAQVDEALRKLFRDLVDGVKKWPLYLHGPVGTGKTSAALALCDFTRSGFWTCEELSSAIVSNETEPWDEIKSVELAVLDDIGLRARIGDLNYITVYNFAEARVDRNNIAIYVTNVTPDQIFEVYDERIASRLLCGTQFELK